jgi:pilus assembly protein CpaF
MNLDRRSIVADLISAAAAHFKPDGLNGLIVERDDLIRFCNGRLEESGSVLEASAIVDDVVAEILGFGPVNPLFQDPSVTDILINGHDNIFVERNGRLEWVEHRFNDEDHLASFVHRHVSRAGRAVNRARPWTDVELFDGSRMHVVASPVAERSHLVSIRRFRDKPFSLPELEGLGAITAGDRQWLESAMEGRLNLVIAGAPGVGKSSLLAALLGLAPAHERILLLEDVSELRVDHPHCVRLQTRAIAHGQAEQVNIRSLVKETLRMRPDRLIVGEVRGDEAFDMLNSMSTGLRGCMTTVHAGSADEALARLATLYAQGAGQQDTTTARRRVEAALDAVIFLNREPGGRRRLGEIRRLERVGGSN